MSFAQENGYTPASFEALMNQLRERINAQFQTSYSEESFVGTSWYKYWYLLVQRVQGNEIKTAEIFQKLQQYIALTNERIQRPSVSWPGLIESFQSEGFVVSAKPPAEEDAGKIFICVDLDDEADDYGAKKLQVCQLIKEFVTGGLVSQGTEVESITLSNGQSFPFRFNLPNRIPVLLRLTLVTSENNMLTIPPDEDIRQIVFDRIKERYRLGWNFEPQRYYTLADAPWAATATLEWSDDDGETWHSEVFDAEYTDLFVFGLEDIQVLVDP